MKKTGESSSLGVPTQLLSHGGHIIKNLIEHDMRRPRVEKD